MLCNVLLLIASYYAYRRRDVDFHGGRETLRKLLHDLNFRFLQANPTRKMIETERIMELRRIFLRTFRLLKISGLWDFIYIDETWVFRRGTGKLGKEWQDVDIRSCPSSSMSSGGRYIVIHGGGKDGFVSNAGKVWCSSKRPNDWEDYHGDMNGVIFRHWLENDLLPNLAKPSVIILDNASYHCFQAIFFFWACILGV
jgi:hypothetical protein